MITRVRILLVLFALLAVSCAGSTSFLGDDLPTMTLAPGTGDSVTLEFEAEGSHSGEYDFTATVTAGEGLSATVEPTTAEVDGVIDIVVTVSASDTAPAGVGSVLVEGTGDGGNAAGTSVAVTVTE